MDETRAAEETAAEVTGVTQEEESVTGAGGGGLGIDAEDADMLPEGWNGKAPFPETEADPLGLFGPEADPFGGSGGVPSEDRAAAGGTEGASAGEAAADAAAAEEQSAAGEAQETGAAAAAQDAAQDAAAAQDVAAAQDAAPDYKALYEAEVERRNAEKFRKIFRSLVEEDGMPESVARLAAANELGGKVYPLEDAPEAAETAEKPGKTGTESKNFAQELKELRTLWPDIREMPREVMQEYAKGSRLVDAFAAWRTKQDGETLRELRAENERLKKEMENYRRAPVGGVSTGGAKQEPVDPMLAAFDAEGY